MQSISGAGEDLADPLLSLPFDHYQRYALTQRLVGLLGPEPGRRALRVLDVGGHSSSLKHFLPEDEVILADMQAPPAFAHRERVPFRYDGYVLAAGQALPFSAGAFDVVTAHDTLEHVPDEHRQGFLRELLRVARRYVILTGPVYQPETAQAEQRLADFMQRALQGGNVSLNEHLALGLPKRKQIESAFREQGSPFVSVPNGNLVLWLAMMALKHYVIAFPNSDWLHEVIDRTYNAILSPHDFGGQCYREAYVIAKDQRDLPALQAVEAALAPPLRVVPRPEGTIEALEMVLRALEEHAADVRRELSELVASVARGEAALVQARSLLAQREAEKARLQEVVGEREDTIRVLESELQSIRSSAGYRLLSFYRRVMRRLFPAGSWRGAPYRALVRVVKRVLARRDGGAAHDNSADKP